MNNNSMANGHGNPQDFQYAVDPELLDESSWINPQVEQYAHHGQFLPQQNYQQFPLSTPQYGNYGTTHQIHQSPYTQQSPYGNQFGHHENVDPFIMPQQYGINYHQAAPVVQPQQQANNDIFSYSNPNLVDSTISPQALQRQRVEVAVPQGQARGDLANATSRPASIPNASATFRQGWADNTTGEFHGQAVNGQTASYNHLSNASQSLLNYPPLSTATATSEKSIAPQASGGFVQRDSPQIPVHQNIQRLVARPSVRLTHSDLLSTPGNVPFRKPANAPFIFIDDVPEEFQFGGKCK
jgi:hypothetical protein